MSLKGVKRLKGALSRPKRQPVTIDTSKLLKKGLRTLTMDERDKFMFWAAFTTAFFAFLRSAKFYAPHNNSFDPRSCLLVTDDKASSHDMIVNINASKADSCRNGHAVCLSATGSSVCPLRSLRNHLMYCKNPEIPLLTFVSHTSAANFHHARSVETFRSQVMQVIISQFLDWPCNNCCSRTSSRLAHKGARYMVQ